MDRANPRTCQSGKFKVGDCTFDLSTLTLCGSDGAEIHLRSQSARVLAALVEAEGQLVKRDALIERIWSGIAVTDDSLVQCIKDHEGARRDCHRALRLNPVFRLAHFTLAENEIFAGEMASGIMRLEAMMKRTPLDPQNPLCFSMIALGWVLLDAPDKAFPASQEAFELWPGQPWCALVHAVAAVAAGKAEGVPDPSLLQRLPPHHFSDLPFAEKANGAMFDALFGGRYHGTIGEAARRFSLGLADAESTENRLQTRQLHLGGKL